MSFDKPYRWDDVELGISYFSTPLPKGLRKEFPPQIHNIGESPNVTLLPVGLIRTWNENREHHLDVPGRPGRIYGGLLLPGKYTIEALEDSIYICVSVLNEVRNMNMIPFELVPLSLKKYDAVEVSWEAGFRAGICAYGTVEVDGIEYQAGEKYLIAEGQTVQAIAKTDCELVGYRMKTPEV